MQNKTRYVAKLHKEDLKSIFRSLIPEALLRFRNRLRFRRWHPNDFISSDSIVTADLRLGGNCVIRGSHISATDIKIGQYTTLSSGSNIGGRGSIRIGNYCSIGPDFFAWSENHNELNRSHYPFTQMHEGESLDSGEYTYKNISIGNDVWVGAKSTVLAGAMIGDGCIVASGSVVTAGKYPPYTLLGGVPARVRKDRFSSEVKKHLLGEKWWDLDENEIFGIMQKYLQSKPE